MSFLRSFLPLLLFLPVAAAGQNALPASANEGTHLRLPGGDVVFFGQPPLDADSVWNRPAPRLRPLSAPQISVGELNVYLGGGSAGTHVSHYDLGDRRIFGAEIGGTLDGSRGTIRLRWQTGR
jgi:hypothetical protein